MNTNARYRNINLNKRHIIQTYDGKTIIIDFTPGQDIYPGEEYSGMNGYECFILDDEFEPSTRAVYYYDMSNDLHYLKYYEDYDDTTKTTITVYRIIEMDNNDTVEEAISKAEYDEGLTMGDIC